MLKEGAAMHLVESKIPSPTPEQRRRGIELALADLAKNGVTSAQDNSAWEDFLTYRGIKNDGKLTVRITEWLPFAAQLEKLEQMRRDGGTTDSWLRTGALKMVTDGALGSRTAAIDRKSTRLNSSHSQISYAVFCLKKKINFYYI